MIVVRLSDSVEIRIFVFLFFIYVNRPHLLNLLSHNFFKALATTCSDTDKERGHVSGKEQLLLVLNT